MGHGGKRPDAGRMSAIERCRTAALGGHTHIAYNSCRNRHCPKCQAAASRRSRSGAVAHPVLSRRVHAAEQAARHRLSEQARGLRPADEGGGRDNARHRRQSQAPRRQDWRHRRAAHLGLDAHPSSARAYDRARWRALARRIALDRLPLRLPRARQPAGASIQRQDAGDAHRCAPRRPVDVLQHACRARRQDHVQALHRPTAAHQVPITAVPKLLEMLRLKGTIVTADALNCQRAIAQQIVDQGGDYALALKGNQGTLHDDVVLYLDDPASKAITAEPVVEADHGRIETRTATVSTDIAWLNKDHHWPGLAAVGKVERRRETAGKTTSETAYYLLSAPLPPERFNEVVRSHWGVENRLHWRLDVVMNEDQDRSRLGNGPHNLAVLRHMALNVMQKDGEKGSLRG